MDFPIRTNSHIKESQSLKILMSVLPSQWIIRELSERDYGVDLYIELTKEDGRITGDMVAIQLKGTQSVIFDAEDKFLFKNIKKSTINYWLGLPIPVFPVVVSLNDQKVYWSSVEQNNREGRFFNSNKTYTLLLDAVC